MVATLGGIVFCLSLKLTGSLWWIVGMHAGWDWAESYFYGVADSGEVAHGHLLDTHPIGSTLWNGGSAGPEASPYVFPVFLLLGLGMWLMWGKRRRKAAA